MNILVTGGNGFLGGKTIKKILLNTKFGVVAVASSEKKVREMQDREQLAQTGRIRFLSNEELLNPKTELKDIYGAVHLAFARRARSAADIASSLVYASSVFHKLAECNVDRVINISSQGVYGSTSEIRTELTPAAPENHYTMAKYAAEILFTDIIKDAIHHTNLRLDLVTQSQNIVNALCRQAKEGKISLRGGRQVFSFIDGEDVGAAVAAMLQAGGDWEPIYNVGWNRRRYTLVDLADIIANTAVKCGFKRPEIVLDEQDINSWAGMDSCRFIDRTGWKPEKRLEDTVAEILET